MSYELKLKIEDIIKLKSTESCSWSDYINLDFLAFYTDNYKINDIESCLVKDKIKIEEKIHDTISDCRQRSLCVIYFEDKPFVLYQDNGKGENYSNTHTIDKHTFANCLNYINTLLAEQTIENDESYDTIIDIKSYNMIDLYLEDNTIKTKRSDELIDLNKRLKFESEN